MLWSILFLIVAFFLYKGLIPGGRLFFSHNFSSDGVFVSKLSPDDRFRVDSNNNIDAIGNPLYFNLRTLRNFQRVDMTLVYKNEEFSLLEAGVLMDGSNWNYQLKPLENKIIDRLISNSEWSMLEDSGLLLLQKSNKYSSISKFLKNPPESDKLALYNYNLKSDYLVSDYKASNTKQKIEVSLRGPYEFFTYIKDEDLDFELLMQDLNQNKDPDPIDIYLYYQDEIIQTWSFKDDGVVGDTGVESEDSDIFLKVSQLPEGVYKVGVKANDDIITKELITKQGKVSFLNNVNIYSQVKSEKIYTDSSKISVKIERPQNLQNIIIRNLEKDDFEENLKVEETYKKFEISLEPDSVYELSLEKAGLLLSGNGNFSFSKKAFLNPRFKRVSPELDIENNQIGYILANYSPPKKENGWTVARASFDISRAYTEDDNHSFILSIPGLRVEDEIDDRIIIKEVRFDLIGPSFWQLFKNLFN